MGKRMNNGWYFVCYAPTIIPDLGKHSLEINVIIKSKFSKAEPCRTVEAMGSSPDKATFFLLKANFARLCFSREVRRYFHRNGGYCIVTNAHGYDLWMQYIIYVPCWNDHKDIECDGGSRRTIDMSLLTSDKVILLVLQRSQHCLNLKCLPQNDMLKYRVWC